MKRASFILLSGVLLSMGGLRAEGAVAINFTPWPVDLVMDGFQVKEVKFSSGAQSIRYRPPSGWVCEGTQSRATLTTPEYSSIRGEISFLKEKQLDFLPEHRAVLRGEVVTLLPGLAKEVKLEGELQNSIKVDGEETLFFRYSGELFADRYQFLVFLFPFEKGTVCFSLYGNEREIKESEEAFLRSILSWRFE